jgi:hypothetical protein
MSKSPQSANRVTRLRGLPSRSLCVDPRDRRDIGHDGTDVRPVRLDRQNTTPWSSSILAFFMEGFALHGASYHASPQAIAASFADTSRAEASAPQPEENSWRARRGAMAIVSSAMHSRVAELEGDINRAAPGSATASGDTSFDADRSNGRSWLTKPWQAIAARWPQGRREREIKKAFAALMEPDRRASRNFGIPHRSGIKQVARYRRDC